MKERKGIKNMSKCILVVDDNEMNLRMAEHTLKANSYEVITASSGAQGLDQLRTRVIDLILLDIEMPIMSGIQMFEYIRKEHYRVPVIFLTASGDKRDVMEVLKMGAVDYVKKPFVPQDLLDRVARVFGRS